MTIDIRAALTSMRYEANRKHLNSISGGRAAYQWAAERDRLDTIMAALPADETCNGWRNYETNMIQQLLSNDPTQWAHIFAQALQVQQPVDTVKNLRLMTERLPEYIKNRHMDEAEGLTGQLANAALLRVDWRALAAHWLDEAAVNPIELSATLATPRPFYELAKTDVNKSTIRAFGKSWQVSEFIGHIMPQDVGKRVYQVGDIVQVENDEQRARRLAKD